MGTSNSCLPVSLNSLPTFRSRGSTSKLVYDVHEAFNNNNKNAIDINRASVDELSLLPGITRELAIDIVQYRIANNGFQQINELAKVNGMTSDIFKQLYNDITIDVPVSSKQKQELVNLNIASYEELCLVPGLTSNFARRIIQRRNRKGLFRFIEDLLKIRGIDYIILATVRPYVTVNQPQIPASISNYSLNSFYPLLNRTTAPDAQSLASLLLETLPPELQTILVSSPPHRPAKINDSREKSFRFSSWNLQNLTNEKAQNPGVREVICRVILENNFSLIAIQEIGNKETLDVIVEELNNPTIPSIKDWPNRHQGKWNSAISETGSLISHESEYLGFIYDESVGIQFNQASLLSPNTHFSQSPFLAVFRIMKKFEFVFVNIHFNPDKKGEATALSVLAQAMENTIEQKHIVILGNFNMPPTTSQFEPLTQRNYSYVIKENTDIDSTNTQGSACVDNIWLSSEAKALSTEYSGVIRDNLSSLWIPTGWTWGGLVSDHCPIWLELNFS